MTFDINEYKDLLETYSDQFEDALLSDHTMKNLLSQIIKEMRDVAGNELPKNAKQARPSILMNTAVLNPLPARLLGKIFLKFTKWMMKAARTFHPFSANGHAGG